MMPSSAVTYFESGKVADLVVLAAPVRLELLIRESSDARRGDEADDHRAVILRDREPSEYTHTCQMVV